MRKAALCLLAAVPLLNVCLGPEAASAASALPAWEFREASNLEGWGGNGRVLGLSVEGGCLAGEALDGDPIIVGPLVQFDTALLQFVEIKMRADRGGVAQIFWAADTQGPYGGFRTGKEKRFTVIGDGEFHIYRLFPFWQGDPRIVRLRLDPPDSCRFAIDYIRVGEQSVERLTETPRWDFSRTDASLWQPVSGVSGVSAHEGAMRLSVDGEEPLVAAPVRDFDTASSPFASLRIESARARRIYLCWSTDEAPGLSTVAINLEPGLHLYLLPLSAQPSWRGNANFLGLLLAPGAYDDLAVHSVLLGARPEGPAEIKIVSLMPVEGICRAQRPFRVRATIANVGASEATVAVALDASAPATITHRPTSESLTIAPDEEVSLEWGLGCDGAANVDLSLRASGEWGELEKHSSVTVTEPVNYQWQPDEDRNYVPRPRPVKGDYEVGVYYFPGWKGYSRWQCLERFPERRPLLGYYREGEPEVADWQIKWAVEHGITFFIYDWYWSQGARQLEHGLHDGYFKSRNHQYLKFCLLWANHNPPGTSSREDLLAVTDYWIANYFLRPEYLKVEGKPAMFIFSPGRLTEDLGSEAVAAAFEEMRAKCRQAGLAGLYLVGCSNDDPNNLRRLKEEGYDAASGYNYPGAGMQGGLLAPYSGMVDGCGEIWENVRRAGAIDYIVPTSPGWDSRPWHGDDALVRSDSNPREFGRMLRLAKQFVDTQGSTPFGKMVIIEAWNEFGEGSYIEPHRQFGFGYLDAIREVFVPGAGAHPDLVPEDVGLGPYETPKPLVATHWEFDKDGDFEGWDSYGQMDEVEVRDGCLRLRSTGPDPMIFGPPTQIEARKLRRLSLRMSTDKPGLAQIFWQWEYGAMSEATSVRFELIPDGEMHTYEADLSGNGAWRGTITQLRLDPTYAPSAHCAIDRLRVE